jgi:hypothetical protein
MTSTDTMTQLRAMIADETAALSDRKTAASHITALTASAVDLTIPANDPEYLRLTADHIDMDGGTWQFKVEPRTHDEAIAEIRDQRIRAAHGVAARDTGRHRLERLASVAAILSLLSERNFYRVNVYTPERLLDNLDRTGRWDGVE